MRAIDADALIDRIKNPYEQAQVARWVNEQPTIEQEKRTKKRTETHACDLISRQAAIDAINQICPIDTEYDCTLLDRVDVRCVLTDLPSAQPERKKGRWIHDGYAFKGGIDWMHCSECGHKDSWSAATRTPFCAWCGARMEGE